jgi:excisionase family DNA binding protein
MACRRLHLDDLLTSHEAAQLVGVAPDTWRSWVHRGRAPAAVTTVAGSPLWLRADVEQWMARRPRAGTR